MSTSTTAAMPTVVAPVAVTEDDEERALLAPSDLATAVPLSTVIDSAPRAWRRLVATTDDGRRLDVEDFAARYPEREPRLYLDASGQPALGLFQPIPIDATAAMKARLRKPHLPLVGVTSVEIRTSVEAAADGAAEGTPLTVRTPAGEVTLTPEKLATLTRVHRRGRGRRRAGWRLGDVLALAGVEGPVGVQVESRVEEPLRVRPVDLAHPDLLALLRYNRRGQLRFALFGPERRPRARSRDVHRLVVTPASQAAPTP